jgi:hypothetical protein
LRYHPYNELQELAMLILALFIILFAPPLYMITTLETLFTPSELEEMGVRLEYPRV